MDQSDKGVIDRQAGEVATLAAQIPRQIANEEEYMAGLEWLARIAAKRKEIESFAESITGPINDALVSAREHFKGALSPLVEPETRLRDMIRGYRDKRRVELTAEQERELEEYEVRRHLAEEAGEDWQAVEPPAVVRALTKIVQTKYAKIQFNRSPLPNYMVSSADLVPDEYWSIDDAKIRAALKAGVQIAGVVTWPGPEVIQVKKR